MKKRRKLKPIPKLIFDTLRILFFGAIALYLATYLCCMALYVNASQMDARYDYLTQEMENK